MNVYFGLTRAFCRAYRHNTRLPSLICSSRMSPNAPFVELRNVTFGYGERVILRDLSLQVPRGKVTALMGASGGGKTTVLRLIGGQNPAQ